jgi:hypothetical protein
VGVWAGDDSPSKRDRQLSLWCLGAAAMREAAALPRNRGNQKAQVPSPRHEPKPTAPAVDSLQHSNVYNLVSTLIHASCSISVYCVVDFVNQQFVTYMAAYEG